MAESIIWFVGAMFLVVLGYQIKVKKRYDLIAGYEPSRTPNPELLGSFIGDTLFKGAGFLVGLAILRFVLPDYSWFLRVGFVGGLVWIGISLLIGSRRITQK